MPIGSGKFMVERRGRALGSVKLVWARAKPRIFSTLGY